MLLEARARPERVLSARPFAAGQTCGGTNAMLGLARHAAAAIALDGAGGIFSCPLGCSARCFPSELDLDSKSKQARSPWRLSCACRLLSTRVRRGLARGPGSEGRTRRSRASLPASEPASAGAEPGSWEAPRREPPGRRTHHCALPVGGSSPPGAGR